MNFLATVSAYVEKNQLIKIASIIIGGYLLYFILKHFGRSWINGITSKRYKKTDKEEIQKRTKTVHKFLLNTLKTVMIFIVFFLVLDQLGVNITPFLTGAGIIGVAIGFGSQTLVKDYICGILILTEDQFRKGDEVEIAKIKGTIKDFTLRKTILIDKDGTYHYISNSQITTVSNFSRNKIIKN